MPDHIVLAYSGGLDTSVAVHWLATTHDAQVTALLLDMGQDDAEIAAAKERALANGAKDAVVVDALDAFAAEYVAPAIRANAMYEGVYPLGTALSRPLIAKALVEVAHQVGADAVAHGCTGKGNDQVRIEAGVKALDPAITNLAPQRTDAMTRDEAIAYAKANDLALPTLSSSPYSTDENIWSRSVEGGDLEDPTNAVPEEAYAWTTSPKKAPDSPETFTIAFEAGVPVALNGKGLDLPELCTLLNQQAGAHGIGRIDHVENRLVGIKSREVYEAPAAAVILAAKQAVECLTLTRDEVRLKRSMEAAFADMTYDGLWFSPAMTACRAFIDTVQANVTGTATIVAFKGTATAVSRDAPTSLYAPALATYGPEDAFDHKAAGGFIAIWSLPMQTATAARKTPPPGKGV